MDNWTRLIPPLVFMAAMLLLFWYIIVIPTKKRQKAHQELIVSLNQGDEIITAGGIHGRITKVREDTVEVEVAPNVRIKLDRRAIRRRAQDGDKS